MLILTFEDSEEEILNHIISCVNTGARAFQVIENAKTNLSFNGLEIDNINRLVRKQKQEIDLTFTEFEILYLLANNLGRVFSKEQIYDIVWKESYSGDYNIVMSHIRNLREKIEDNPSKPIYIQTVWGVGYRFNKNLSSGCDNIPDHCLFFLFNTQEIFTRYMKKFCKSNDFIIRYKTCSLFDTKYGKVTEFISGQL